MAFLYNKATAAAKSVQSTVVTTTYFEGTTGKFGLESVTNAVNGIISGKQDPSLKHRYSSSAPITHGNSVKFHVDGCAYFWAVSEALEKVKESVWILGCMFLPQA